MPEHPLKRIPWSWSDEGQTALLAREWLVTNGLGGSACGSVSGAVTRRYHGLLVAALPAPLGRCVMLTHMAEEMRLHDGKLVRLGGFEHPGGNLDLPGARVLREFALDEGLPVWRYEHADVVLEKRILLPHGQNTVHVTYRLLSGTGPVRLRLRPSMHFRPHESRVDEPLGAEYRVFGQGARYEVYGPPGMPPLKLRVYGERAAFVLDEGATTEYFYRVEAARGYDARGVLWSPGYLRADLYPSGSTTLVASTEHWDTIVALHPEEARKAERLRRRRLLEQAHPAARSSLGADLVLAADQFIITPAGRVADAARARAAGDDIRTVIAGYHWFTDWGRDTMISLEGLTLCTGREMEAAWILKAFAHYVKNGLIPNMFPEHDTEGLYHTADATLWFFHAIHRYVAATEDRAMLRALIPTLLDIVDHHIRGTRFAIAVDPADGLLRQGAEGYQLTWMDAKVDDWVVTPRRGKPVEINALWYNAIRLLEGWLREEGDEERAEAMADLAGRTRRSFNERFWFDAGGHLYDVVDGEHGDDPALRPNQLFAISLDHPVLEQARWRPVLDVCTRELLSPVGLRTLARPHQDFKRRYDGDLRSRDAAYHQGTVWAWLIGPYIDAYLRANPQDREGARRLLDGFREHLDEACIGSISEIFDAEEPYTARGCVAQAWSVAEVLRCWVKTEP